MKTLLITVASALLFIGGANAQTASVTTVTTGRGTITQYVPGTSFVVKETTGPIAYQYGPEVVYATREGVVLTPEQVQASVRIGVPVSVEYVPQGDTRIIRRVVIDDRRHHHDDDDDDDN